MRFLSRFALASAFLVSGCAAIVEGSSQQITVNTTPPGASCTLSRGGATLASIAATPGTVSVAKTHEDIEVVCELDGYLKMAHIDESDMAAAVFGNVLFGGAIGIIVDASTGAAYKYDGEVALALTPGPKIAAPLPVVAVAPLPPPAVALHPEPIQLARARVPVDRRRAENAAERYRALRRLAADGLVPQDRYRAWAEQNSGAFLLLTAEPPVAAVGNKPPSYEQLADFLRSVAGEKNTRVAEAERQALLLSLLPIDGTRAAPQKPPSDEAGRTAWYVFLDRLAEEGLLSDAQIEAEKAAIEGNQLAALD